MLKGSRCCTSGLSFIAGASPRVMGVAADGAPGAWRAVPWIPAPRQAGKGAGGVLSPLTARLSSHLNSHLPSPSSAAKREQPSPADHPGVLGSPLPPPGRSSSSSSLPATSIHPPSSGFARCFSPHISSLQDITSTLPCPVSRRADVAGVAVGGGEEPHGERDP